MLEERKKNRKGGLGWGWGRRGKGTQWKGLAAVCSYTVLT
jgi:hypothetical protein